MDQFRFGMSSEIFPDFLSILFTITSCVFLVLIFFSDLFQRRIYLWQIIGIGGISLMYHLLRNNLSLLQMGLGVILGVVFFGLQFLLSNGKAIGSGDVLLGITLGCVFGWSSLCFIILTAYVGGASISLILLGLGRIQRTDSLPLGSFLCASSVFTLFFPHPWTLLGVT